MSNMSAIKEKVAHEKTGGKNRVLVVNNNDTVRRTLLTHLSDACFQADGVDFEGAFTRLDESAHKTGLRERERQEGLFPGFLDSLEPFQNVDVLVVDRGEAASDGVLEGDRLLVQLKGMRPDIPIVVTSMEKPPEWKEHEGGTLTRADDFYLNNVAQHVSPTGYLQHPFSPQRLITAVSEVTRKETA
ncbi:MAG: hypothetical protein ABH851_03955 [Methanobacteriota archaeon]